VRCGGATGTVAVDAGPQEKFQALTDRLRAASTAECSGQVVRLPGYLTGVTRGLQALVLRLWRVARNIHACSGCSAMSFKVGVGHKRHT